MKELRLANENLLIKLSCNYFLKSTIFSFNEPFKHSKIMQHLTLFKNTFLIFLAVVISGCLQSNRAKISADASKESFLPAAAVATAHPLATEAALDILQQGGNAFDAAVAASAALAVVEPSGSGMGGGGFWLLHRQSDGKKTMLDGRETAPSQAHANMYLDEKGEVIKGASLNGPLAAGIPGQAAALVHLSKNYGVLPLSVSLEPAIRYAETGFPVYPRLLRHLKFRSKVFNDAAKQVFMPNNTLPELGDIIKQNDLAKTLRLFAAKGNKGFYQGKVAKKMLNAVQQDGGIWQAEDLRNYRVLEREPIRFPYRNATIVSAAPPSSGGIVLGQILRTIELKQLAAKTPTASVPDMHLVVEAMRRAYRDRALYLGDGDYVKIDKKTLLSKEYLQNFAAEIQSNASKSAELTNPIGKGTDTTHFSIIDRDGNRVAATLSINYPFGSGHMAEGTGVFLNNEMDDFVAKAGVPNVYGLVGGNANKIEPGKRPLSSMSPTFIETKDRVVAIGTPGGSRIISMVALATMNLLDRGLDLQTAIDAPRFHHQYLPDAIQLEKDAGYQGLSLMKEKGHEFKRLNRKYGNMQAVGWQRKDGKTVLSAASDSRGEGTALLSR